MSKFFVGILLCLSVSAQAELKTVEYIDPALYLGTWYQIARNPHPFERGCVCARQVLDLLPSGEVGVFNSCSNETVDGPVREIRGTATIDDASNSKLTVDFGLPRKGQYWIIAVAPDYQWAVVSEPSLQTLYVLAKTPELAPELYSEAVAQAALQLDTSKLSLTLQQGCSYPPNLVRAAPASPSDPLHPGSKIYGYGMEKKNLTCQGRDVTVFLPTGGNSVETFPSVVYGHGQALGLENYSATLEHLAKKGVAAIFPTYDNGFFDQDWPRMGRDYVNLTDCALKQTPKLAPDQVVFSGHSKGAYVASIAAGIAVKENLGLRAKSVVLFEAAGFDSSTIGSIEPTTPLTVVFADKDTVVQRNLSDSIYTQARSEKKQFIFVKSYPGGAVADHYWPQTQGSFFGGGPESALHYYGEWKWLVAAALDLKNGGFVNNPFLYGPEAGEKGNAGLKDDVTRSW